LTGPRTAGQSRIVMAALVNDRDAQRENERDERDAQGGKTVRGDSGCCLGGDSAEVRVHLYKRSFPEEPDRHARELTRTRCAHARHRRRIRRCHRHRAFSPDDRDMHVGCERPPAGQAWGEEGGSQIGVAHAPLPLSSAATAARTATPAAQNAAGLWPPNSQTGKNMKAAHLRHRAITHVTVQRERLLLPGNGAPEFRFPPPVPPLEARAGDQGRRRA
jgi:hypothetical protein